VTEMTAKSGMVFNRLLSSGGKGETHSYWIQQLMIELSRAVSCKFICLSIYYRTITD